MKLKQSHLAFWILFASSVFAGQSLVCEEPLKDFGAIEEGRKLSHAFIVKNISTEVLDVNEVVPSCGCIITSMKEFKLKPNESMEIKIEFDSSGAGGMKIYKTISVCPKNYKAPLILTVEADVKAIPPEKRITISPTQKILEGNSIVKDVFCLQVPADPNFSFTIDVPPWLSYSLQKNRFNDLVGVVNWDVEIYLKAKQLKKLSGDIIFNSNLPRFEKVIVPIKVEPRPMFNINPYMITFDGSEPNQIKEVSIKRNDNIIDLLPDSFEIKSSKACVEMNWTDDGKVIHLKVTNRACEKGFGKIEIRTSDDVIGMIPVVFK